MQNLLGTGTGALVTFLSIHEDAFRVSADGFMMINCHAMWVIHLTMLLSRTFCDLERITMMDSALPGADCLIFVSTGHK
jgi:hypothetical protein